MCKMLWEEGWETKWTLYIVTYSEKNWRSPVYDLCVCHIDIIDSING